MYPWCYTGTHINIMMTAEPFWSSILTLFLDLQYKGANIQLLDLPGIIEGAAQGELYVVVCILSFLVSVKENM